MPAYSPRKGYGPASIHARVEWQLLPEAQKAQSECAALGPSVIDGFNQMVM